jgi:hypothetical protein
MNEVGMEKIKLIAIVGTDRSGSTLLDKIIASNPGIFSVGEVHRFINYYTDNYPCACGKEFYECSFWHNVLNRLKQTSFEPKLVAILGWRWQVKILLERVLTPSSRPRPRHFKYTKANALLYQAILAQTKAEYLVDSCKDIIRLYLLHLSGLFDICPIYISRSVNDYVVSTRTPQMKLDPSRKTGPRKAVLRWMYRNAQTRLMVRSISTDYLQISYNRLAIDPAGVIDLISDKLGFPMRYDPELINQTTYHFLGGNLMKWEQFTGVHPDVKDFAGIFDSTFMRKSSRILDRFFVRDKV